MLFIAFIGVRRKPFISFCKLSIYASVSHPFRVVADIH